MESIANTLKRFEIPSFTPEQLQEMDRRAKEDEARRRAEDFRKRLNDACIPQRYSNADVRMCERRVADYANSVGNGGSGWLVLTGLNGRGKTYAACACLLEALRAGKRGLYAKTKTILDECSATYGDYNTSERQVIGKYLTRDVLVIDDLGKENTTDWSTPIIFEIIDGRYEREKPTIFTTNLDANQLIFHLSKGGSQLMAESIVSRMADSTRIRMEGSDRRLVR